MVAQGRFREGEAEFRRAVVIAPKYAPSWNSLGVALANQGPSRDAEAEAAFREASRLSPRMVDPRANLGLLYLRVGRYGDAVAPLREALTLDPQPNGGLEQPWPSDQRNCASAPAFLQQVSYTYRSRARRWLALLRLAPTVRARVCCLDAGRTTRDREKEIPCAASTSMRT